MQFPLGSHFREYLQLDKHDNCVLNKEISTMARTVPTSSPVNKLGSR